MKRIKTDLDEVRDIRRYIRGFFLIGNKMSKGSGRRKKLVTDKQYSDNWDKIFNKDFHPKGVKKDATQETK
jgi:hypothetical protein